MRLFGFLVSMTGCASTSRLDTSHWQFEYSTPTISSLTVSCEDQVWTIETETDGWTGNGLLWLANGDRYERHSMYSINANHDGSYDRLRSQLTVVSDWRDQQSSRSTGFECGDLTALGIFIAIRHPESFAVSDCAEYASEETFIDFPTLSLWEPVPLPTCPNTTEE